MIASPRMSNSPTPEDVRTIVALESDPILRNLRITEGYHGLSEGMRRLTGEADINWCTLGTWASKTAGRFIRSDELPSMFKKLLEGDGPIREAEKMVGVDGLAQLAGKIVRDVSGYIMVGNRVVFEELGGVFAAFLAELGGDAQPDPERLARFQDRYTTGMPEPDHVTLNADGTFTVETRGGQGLMRDMIADYYAAKFETDPKRRAELLLRGNARGGLHEQTRLQTYIAGSLDAPIENALVPHAHGQVDANHRGAAADARHALVDSILPAICRRLEKAWEDFATLALMELLLPDGVLHLSKPLPAEVGRPIYPPTLATIDDPTLRELLGEYGALELAPHESLVDRIEDRFAALLGLGHPQHLAMIDAGAINWVELPQRMKYIFALFRSRADDLHLTAPPFSSIQRVLIEGGQVPAGPL